VGGRGQKRGEGRSRIYIPVRVQCGQRDEKKGWKGREKGGRQIRYARQREKLEKGKFEKQTHGRWLLPKKSLGGKRKERTLTRGGERKESEKTTPQLVLQPWKVPRAETKEGGKIQKVFPPQDEIDQGPTGVTKNGAVIKADGQPFETRLASADYEAP